MTDEEEHLSAVLAAAVERAAAGPFKPDGSLSDEAAAGVRAVLAQAGGDSAPVPFAEGGPATRHTDADFSDDEMLAFFSGYWVPCRSSHVGRARYHADSERLELEFDDGTRGHYPSVTADMAEDFGRAPSKGGYLWDSFIPSGWPFVTD